MTINKTVVFFCFLLFTLGCSSKVQSFKGKDFIFTINNLPDNDINLLVDSLQTKESALFERLDKRIQKEYYSILIKNVVARRDLILKKYDSFKVPLNKSDKLEFIVFSDTSRTTPITGFIGTSNQHYKYTMTPRKSKNLTVDFIETIEKKQFKEVLNSFNSKENCFGEGRAILTELKKENHYWNVKITLGCSEKTKTD